MPQPGSFRDNSWTGKSRMPLVIARYSRVLEKNIDWSLRLCTTLKKITTQGYGIVSLLGYSICYSPHLLYLWVQKCLGFIKIPWLKPCVKGGLLSVVNLLCNHDHTMIAMNLKQKFKLKTIKKKLHFSSMLMAVTSAFEEGLLKSGAQTLSNPWS